MRKINQWYRQLPNSVATVMAFFAAIIASILASVGAGLVVVLLWYRDTRTDGLAAFLVVSLAVGLLVSILVFLNLSVLHRATSAKFAFVAPVVWLGTAVAFTW